MIFNDKKTYTVKIEDTNKKMLVIRDVLMPKIIDINNPEKVIQIWKEYMKKFSDEEKIYFIRDNGQVSIIMKDKITGFSVDESGIKGVK